MVQKIILIAKLKKLVDDAKHIVDLCNLHGKDEHFFEKLNEAELLSSKKLLDSLRQDSETHAKTLRDLIAAVQAVKQDAF